MKRRRPPERALPYMREAWYALLAREVDASSLVAVARRLGVSHGAVSQVLRGTGLYGDGAAGTRRFGQRVLEILEISIECPFLTQFTGEPRRISGPQCRDYAYREAPTANPHDGRHWRACRTCEQRVLPPRGWDEARGCFVDSSALRKRRAAKTAAAVAAATAEPQSTPQEAA